MPSIGYNKPLLKHVNVYKEYKYIYYTYITWVRKAQYWYIQGGSKSLCAPDDHNTESYKYVTSNLAVWHPTARARGTLVQH
jgi:hypothetical protein